LRISLGTLWIVDGLLQAQPEMPASFIPRMISPALEGAPTPIVAMVEPFARLWLQHPVAADAVTIWIQIGLGAAILLGGAGRIARAVLLASAVWAGFVWLVGEVVGGLADPRASFLTGVPGAALLYIAASFLLIVPLSAWDSGRAGLWTRRTVGATFVLGGALAALPRTGLWESSGLANVFSDIASGGVPAPAAAPITALATSVVNYASVANAVFVVILLGLGAGLLLGRVVRVMSAAAMIVSILCWWFGQGFGVFGGVGTDPNTGLVLLLMLLAAWPWPRQSSLEEATALPPASGLWAQRVRLVPRVLAALAVCALPLVAGIGLLGEQTAQAAIGDGGGVVELSPAPAPDFVLTDQSGRQVAMRDTRGTLTIVVFLDPECLDSCPLLANQLASAVEGLGKDGISVSILAIDVNPVFNTVDDVSTFTRAHGLDSLPNWHFLTGTTTQIGDVLASFGAEISVPDVGMIGHPQTVHLFGRDGESISVLYDTANEDLTSSYVALISAELRRHL